jgi:hypothetical protein
MFSNKIGGARRKLTRQFELDFLDGPVLLLSSSSGGDGDAGPAASPPAASPQGGYGWWVRDERGQHIGVEAPFDYIREYTKGKQYDAILGFSQGGLLATALALSGDIPNIKAVVTAGAPHVDEPFDVAMARAAQNGNTDNAGTLSSILLVGGILAPPPPHHGKSIPKLHFAGDTDAIISVERVERLSEAGGNGIVLRHEKGHLFPTKAEHVNAMMAFLEQHVLNNTSK